MSISASFASHGSVDLYVPIVDWGVRAAAVHGADPHVGHARLGRPPGGAAHAADARRRARPSERRRGAGSGAPSARRSARARSWCCSAGRSAAWWAGSCCTRSSTAGACCCSGSPPGVTAAACTVAVLRAHAAVSRLRGVPPADLLCPRRRPAAPARALRAAHERRRLLPVELPAGADRPRHARRGGRRRSARPSSERSFMVASDIHANWLTLPAFARYADHRPVFLVGDFALAGHADRGVDRPARGRARPPDGRRLGQPRLAGRHAPAGPGRRDRAHALPAASPADGTRPRAGRSSRSTASWSRDTRIRSRRRPAASATGST